MDFTVLQQGGVLMGYEVLTEKLEVLLASAVHLLDCWEDISAETGEEPENYGEQRAILQAEYDAIKC